MNKTPEPLSPTAVPSVGQTRAALCGPSAPTVGTAVGDSSSTDPPLESSDRGSNGWPKMELQSSDCSSDGAGQTAVGDSSSSPTEHWNRSRPTAVPVTKFVRLGN